MCQFWSGYMNEAGNIFDSFPYESHSDVTDRPANAAPLEAVFNEANQLQFAEHPLPAWFSDEHREKLTRHIEARAAELEKHAKTVAARKQRAKALARLREFFPDPDRRKIVIARAGNGDGETALRHIQHVRTERAKRVSAPDELQAIHKRAALKWLQSLPEEYISKHLDAVQYRCSARLQRVSDVQDLISACITTGKPQRNSWHVAHAYYKFGSPSATYVVVDPSRNLPIEFHRSSVGYY